MDENFGVEIDSSDISFEETIGKGKKSKWKGDEEF
jgi:hypothetical protein